MHMGGDQLTTTVVNSCSLYAYTISDELASHILKHPAWPESPSTRNLSKRRLTRNKSEIIRLFQDDYWRTVNARTTSLRDVIG